MGRELRTLQRSIIGMTIVDPSPMFLADPFITHVVAGLSNRLSEQGFGLLLHGVKPKQINESFLVRETVVDALCLMLSGSAATRKSTIQLFSSLGQPMLVFQDKPSIDVPDVCFVNQDDSGGADALARHVLRRRPGSTLIVIPKIFWPAIELRLEAIWHRFRQAGRATRILRCDENNRDAIAQAISDNIARHGMPDAIMGGNDKIAAVALRLLSSQGVRVPEQVAVTGFNAFEPYSHDGVTLTSAHSPAFELGQLGAELLLRRLRSTSFESREYTLPVSLVDGTSA
jgi:LacI family transcriptional regulator